MKRWICVLRLEKENTFGDRALRFLKHSSKQWMSKFWALCVTSADNSGRWLLGKLWADSPMRSSGREIKNYLLRTHAGICPVVLFGPARDHLFDWWSVRVSLFLWKIVLFHLFAYWFVPRSASFVNLEFWPLPFTEEKLPRSQLD